MNVLHKRFFDKQNVFYVLQHLVLVIIVVIIIELLRLAFNINEPEGNSIEDSFYGNVIWSTSGIVIFSPILEEIAFRFPLKKNTYYIISIILCGIFLLSSRFIFVKIIFLLFIIAIIIEQNSNNIYPFIIKNITVGLSILTFVSIHFDNYMDHQLDELSVLEKIVLFAPQFFICLLLIKVRLETYLLNAVIIHSLSNLIILTFALFFNY